VSDPDNEDDVSKADYAKMITNNRHPLPTQFDDIIASEVYTIFLIHGDKFVLLRP